MLGRLVDGLTSFGLKLSKKIHSYGDVKRSLHKFGQRIARRPIHHRLAPSNLLELSTCVLTVCFRGHFNYFSKPRNKSQFSFQNSKKNFKFQKFNILGTGCRRGGRGCTSNHVSRIQGNLDPPPLPDMFIFATMFVHAVFKLPQIENRKSM